MAEVQANRYEPRIKNVTITMDPQEARSVMARLLLRTSSDLSVNIKAREIGCQIQRELGSQVEAETMPAPVNVTKEDIEQWERDDEQTTRVTPQDGRPVGAPGQVTGRNTVKALMSRFMVKYDAAYDRPRPACPGVSSSGFHELAETAIRDAYWAGYSARHNFGFTAATSHPWEADPPEVKADGQRVDDSKMYQLRLSGQHLRFLHVAIRRGLSVIVGPHVEATLNNARRFPPG